MPLSSSAPDTGSDDGARRELWTLYDHALKDRDFQVTLGWDRTKHYFLFNAALFSVAGSVGGLKHGHVAQMGLFTLALLHSLFAAFAIWKGHQYYRKARKRVDQLQVALGITTLDGGRFAMKTTRGQERDITPRRRSIGDFLTINNTYMALQLFIAAASLYALISLSGTE